LTVSVEVDQVAKLVLLPNIHNTNEMRIKVMINFFIC